MNAHPTERLEGLAARSAHPGLAARLAAWWRRTTARRAARRELARLNPRLLADIGIEREDIPRVVDALIADRECWMATGGEPQANGGPGWTVCRAGR